MQPSKTSILRCAQILFDYRAGRPDEVRPDLTPEEVAATMLEWSGRQPARLSKEDFDMLAADAILSSWDDTDCGRA